MSENRSHPMCWTGDRYEHRCQTPSGKDCIECGRPAGTLWGPYWCPDCDVIRLDRISSQMESLLGGDSQ